MKGRYFILSLILVLIVGMVTSCGEDTGEKAVVSKIPDTVITSAPDNPTTQRRAVFEFTSDSTDVFYECKLDDGSWLDCASPVTYESVSVGPHQFQVRAVNPAGVADPDPASYTWSVEELPQPVVTEEVFAGYVSGEVDIGNYIDGSPENYLCSLDNGEWVRCDELPAASDLSEGEHEIQIAGAEIDEYGNLVPAGEVTVVTFVVDREPPDTVLTSSPQGIVSVNFAELRFISTGADSHFQCRLDGGEWYECQSPYLIDNLADGLHTFSVAAIDGAGNEDPTPAAVTWTVDTYPPVVSLTSHPAAVESEPFGEFQFTSSEPATFYCKLDGSGWNVCTSPYETPFLENGDHTFAVYGVDAAGNRSQPIVFDWTVNVIPPNVTITSKPPQYYNSTSVTFSYSADKSNVIYKCKLDDGRWQICNSTVSYSGLSEGSHTFSVTAIDAYGYQDPTPAVYSWIIDITPPIVTITSAPDQNPTDFKSAHFEFSSNEPMSYIHCKLDDGDWTDCSGGVKDYYNLSSANHTFYVQGADLAGNVSDVQFSWRVFSWIDVSAGGYHTCAIRDDNSLWCWGYNSDGQIGLGTSGYNYDTPQLVDSDSTWTRVDNGLFFSCATRNDSGADLLFCWGDNVYGQYGLSGNEYQTPHLVSIDLIHDFATGNYHTCFVEDYDDNGTLLCAGLNSSGQLGIGTTTNSSLFKNVGNGYNRIFAGGYHTCALKTDGTLWCWGLNSHGQLGIGNTENQTSPVQVSGNGWKTMSLGRMHTCGIKRILAFAYVPYCWGSSEYGQVGTGTTTDSLSPSELSSLQRYGNIIGIIAAGGYHTCFSYNDEMYCWGDGRFGALGNGDYDSHYSPVLVSQSVFKKLSAGLYHTCGIKSNGTLWCWGYNRYGQLGIGNFNYSYNTPQHVYPSPWP